MKPPTPPARLTQKPSRPGPQPPVPGKQARRRSASRQSFPIVGIGASAGGLEAMVEFLAQVPPDTGMAYVIVQHLDPTQKGMMAELLQRATPMKVVEATDRLKVRPDRIYVIPPNRDMSILHGTLHLLAPAAPRGMRLPIDFFFRSLGDDRRDGSAGIILSGMGSDGTLGLRTIKERGGVALVQDPASAKFDSMPRSAISAGLADYVAPVAELAAKLVAYQRHRPQLGKAKVPMEQKLLGALEKIVVLLRDHTGQDFTLYRRSTLYRRVERRMGIHQIANIAVYVQYLQENPPEVGILFKELLIGVTSFFRDPAAWKQLSEVALPRLLADRPDGTVLRAWVAGCSTGEEAYTLAMAFTDVVQQLKPAKQLSLQIYATDLDKDAINKARNGLYLENIAADVTPARLARFFSKEDGGYRVSKQIRAMVVFAPQNLIMDPPFTKLDLLCCRNLLIYLTPELQRKLFPLFHYSLNPGGVLFLGSAESVGGFTNLFAPLAAKQRVFQRRESGQPTNQLAFPAVFVPHSAQRGTGADAAVATGANLQGLTDRLLQDRYVPPSVLVNEQGDILYVSGRTGKYLEAASGKANWNVIAMAREALRYDLVSAMAKARQQTAPVVVRDVKVGKGDDPWSVDLLVQALVEPKELRGLTLIAFSDTPPDLPHRPLRRAGNAARSQPDQDRLELELQRAREEVQAGREEMQTSQEELKSMNEELQSANEELQSTNEELTTSKEEMQSLNEELQTVNAELQTKLDELSGANNDMKNLLNSTDIATVFLDNELRVRRFTLQAKTIIKFIPSDVGRPITDLASDLLYPRLVADARAVLRTLVFSERAITTNDGRWFTVRIMPYRTTDNRIDGVVITYADITAAKHVEAELREQHGDLTSQARTQGLALKGALHRLRVRSTAHAAGEKADKLSRKAARQPGAGPQ